MPVSYFKTAAARTRFMKVYDEAMKQLPEPAFTFDLSGPFGVVRVYKFGNKEGVPIILLPGRSSSTPMWKTSILGLLSRYCVYTVDLLGMPGKSEQSGRIECLQQQADWVEDMMQQLNLESAHILGASFGGWLAINYAMHFPGRVASLILLDPALVFARLSWKITLFSLPSALPFLPGAWRAKSLSWLSGGTKVNKKDPVTRLGSIGSRDFVVKIPQPVYPTLEQLQSISLPMLVLFAGKSMVHDPQKAFWRTQLLGRRIEAEIWTDAPHAINTAFPDRVNERIHLFLGRQGQIDKMAVPEPIRG